MVSNYVKVEYPQGVNQNYVYLLCEYMVKRYNLCLPGLLLDVGAGTGDYTHTFMFDFHLNALPLSETDLECDWHFPTGSAKYIFCKSVLEHIQNTKGFLKEAKRSLKRRGLAIFLVPDWNSQWRTFYDDSTHIKPFTRKGLEQAFKLAGFKDVQCEYFVQLPFTWRHRWLRWIPYLVRLLPFPTRCSIKLVKFSRERMLLLSARK